MESVINHSRVFPFDYLDKLLKVASWVLDRDVAERHPRDSDSPSSGKPTALNGDCCCSSSSQLRMANDSRSLPRSCLCSNRSGRWPSKSSRVSRQLESAGSAGGTPGKDIPAAQPLLQPTTVTDPISLLMTTEVIEGQEDISCPSVHSPISPCPETRIQPKYREKTNPPLSFDWLLIQPI